MLNPTCDPSKCELKDGSIGMCGLFNKLCICLEEDVEDVCSSALNPMCVDKDCKDDDGNAGKCARIGKICVCDTTEVLDDPCGDELNPKGVDSECKYDVNGKEIDGTCKQLGLAGCNCAPVDSSSCSEGLNPKCSEEICTGRGGIGVCKTDKSGNCVCNVSSF